MSTTVTAARAATLEVVAARHAVAARAAVRDAGDLTLEACIVPWGQVARVTDDGRTFYDESWELGSLDTSGRVTAFDGHVPAGGGPGQLNLDRVPIGRVGGFVNRPDGLWATITLANTSRGRDVYELARTLEFVGVSLEADVPAGATGRVVRTAAAPAALTGVAVVLPPFHAAYEGAMAAARAAAASTEETDDDTDDDDTDDDTTPPPTPDEAIGRTEVLELVRRETARNVGRVGARAVRHPLAAYSGVDALIDAARSAVIDHPEADEGQRVAASRQFAAAYDVHRQIERAALTAAGRAWVDQITTDNPGLMPPSWLTDVFGIIDRGRPGITTVGGPSNAGSSGMDIYWPYLDPALDLRTVVAVQAAQKTNPASVKVSFLRGQATLKTFAGGSDVSYQLQRRSTPSYMALYDRVLQIAYGMVTDADFLATLVAGAGVTLVYDPTTDTDGTAFRTFLFAASLRVRNATGAPANTVLVASDVFALLGGIPELFPAVYGTQNVGGTAQASTLQINVSGLVITEAPMLAAGEILVTNELAAGFPEDGPFLVSAEDVPKLGTDVAIWGLGIGVVFQPMGVVKAGDVASPLAADDEAEPTAKRSSK
jgi:hypothetical protein